MVGLGKGVGVPVKLLHESEGHVVTVRSLDVDARRRRSTRDCAMFSSARARRATATRATPRRAGGVDRRARGRDARTTREKRARARIARGRNQP
jgi:hypothetical protein